MCKTIFTVIKRIAFLLILLLFLVPEKTAAQKISFGIYADPVISWFSSDNKATSNSGSRAGFNFGFTFDKYFAENYAFTIGLSLQSTGGRLVNNFVNKNFSKDVAPGDAIIYKLQYLNVPFGLKFKSNQIGYITIFSDIGLDSKLLVGGKVDIPSLQIKGESSMDEMNRFNMSYHIMAGIEYSLGGSTAMVLGLGFEKNFLDLTKDSKNPVSDIIRQNVLKIRIGVNF
jgi:hypothetical protein